MLSVAVVLGTRPEAIKLSPIINVLRQNSEDYKVTTIATGQHRQVFDLTAGALEIPIDINLGLQRPGQSLGAMSAAFLDALDSTLAYIAPGLVIIQGDTQTAVMGALAASTRRIPVAHVEAGLRSGRRNAPYPEESNRRIIAIIADLHFAPTAGARANLLAEGIDPAHIVVTGNTVIDSLKQFLPPIKARDSGGNRRRILVTCHRRESWGTGVDRICAALQTLVRTVHNLDILFILPQAPDVRAAITEKLGSLARITLQDPMPYPDFLTSMAHSDLILTDSGGVQEEAPSLGVPVILMRAECDRPEALASQHVIMTGTDSETIVATTLHLLDRTAVPAIASSPYGDGHAADRIATAIGRWQRGCEPLLPQTACFAG